MIAFTEIRHGLKDGKVLVIKEGDEVKGLPADVVNQLKEQGIIGDAATTEVVVDEELQKENEDLKAQVEALKKELADASKTPSPAK